MEHRLISRIKRSLAGGVIVAGMVTALVLTVYDPADAAEVETVPSAEPGSVVRVTGTVDSLLLPDEVKLCWDAAGCANLGKVRLRLLETSYSTNVTIPDTAGAGLHAIYACTSLSCASASIEVVFSVEPTTTTTPTTLATTPTTQPTTTTTTTPTTRPPATSVPTTTTPLVDNPRSSSGQPPTGVAEDNATSIEVADPTITPAEDSSAEDAEQPASTDTTVYRRPTTTYSPPTSPSTTLRPDRDSEVIEVAAVTDDGVSYDPRIVFWTLWLLVMVFTGGLVSTIWWLARRR